MDKRVASRREKESIRKELGKSRRNIAKKKNTEETLKRPKIWKRSWKYIDGVIGSNERKNGMKSSGLGKWKVFLTFLTFDKYRVVKKNVCFFTLFAYDSLTIWYGWEDKSEENETTDSNDL